MKTAQDRTEELNAEIKKNLIRIQKWSETQKPENSNWGDVGSANHVAELLKQATDFIFNEWES